MTDWLPWGAVLMAGTFVTLHFVLRSLEARQPDGAIRNARRAFWATVVVSLLTFSLYVAFGEAWIWYH